MGRGHRRVIPAIGLHEPLEGPDRIGIQEGQRDGFDGLGGLRTQEPGQVRKPQAAVLDPPETGVELGVERHEGVGELRHLGFRQRHPRDEVRRPPGVS